MGNAAALLDELVPLAATKLLPGSVQAMGGEKALRTSTLTARSPELKDLRRRLQKAVDKLKLYLCNEIVVGLCYDEYGSKLSAATYFQVEKDQPMWQTDPMPTALFQVWSICFLNLFSHIFRMSFICLLFIKHGS